MTWRKIPEGQELEWAKLFAWLESNEFVTSTDLRAAGVDALAREPQGVVSVAGQRVDTRPDPEKVVELLQRKGVLDQAEVTELRSIGERPLKDPNAILRVLAHKTKK